MSKICKKGYMEMTKKNYLETLKIVWVAPFYTTSKLLMRCWFSAVRFDQFCLSWNISHNLRLKLFNNIKLTYWRIVNDLLLYLFHRNTSWKNSKKLFLKLEQWRQHEMIRKCVFSRVYTCLCINHLYNSLYIHLFI